MYADDTAICVSSLLQEDLSRVNEGLCAYRLNLHVEKNYCMLVTTAELSADVISILNWHPRTHISHMLCELKC